MTSELKSTGLEIDSLEDLIDALIARVRSDISAIQDCGTDTPMGQLIKIFSERLRSALELLQAVHSGQYPSTASGFSLAAISELTACFKREATKSTVECRVNVDAGTYAIGTLIAHVSGDPTARFVNTAQVVNAGPGAADVDDVGFEAEETGPVQALSGTLTVIAEPVAGWNSVTNAPPGGSGDAVEGLPEETDAQLRLRRIQELTRGGSTTVDAIAADLSALDGVLWVAVIENDGDITDGNGIPPHAIECVLHAPTVAAADIAAQILDSKAAGIQAHGDTETVVYDAQGNGHTIGHTAATVVDVYIRVDLTVDADTYVGDTVAKAALADWHDENAGVGDDILIARVIDICMGLTGVEDVTATMIDTVTPPVATTNLVIAWNAIGDVDTSRITVNS